MNIIEEKRRIKRDDFLEYEIEGDRINWIEIAFTEYLVAKTWSDLIGKWAEKSFKPHKILRSGNKWLVMAKGLSFDKFQNIYNSDLKKTPKNHEN